MQSEPFNKTMKKIWNFLWKEESFLAWFVNIILAFLVIKFLIYPLLGVILGTSFPVVAVISGSMEHAYAPFQLQNDSVVYHYCGHFYEKEKSLFTTRDFTDINEFWDECGSFYENKDIQLSEFSQFPFSDGFNKGDLMILHSKENIEVGDVIVFWQSRPEPIIHRVIAVDGTNYLTKGDHNSKEDGWVEDEKVLGKALFKIPALGWVKIWFVTLIGGL